MSDIKVISHLLFPQSFVQEKTIPSLSFGPAYLPNAKDLLNLLYFLFFIRFGPFSIVFRGILTFKYQFSWSGSLCHSLTTHSSFSLRHKYFRNCHYRSCLNLLIIDLYLLHLALYRALQYRISFIAYKNHKHLQKTADSLSSK